MKHAVIFAMIASTIICAGIFAFSKELGDYIRDIDPFAEDEEE